jgi:hypothetical protein
MDDMDDMDCVDCVDKMDRVEVGWFGWEQLKLRIAGVFRYFDRKENFIAYRLVGKIAGRTV